MSMASSGQSRRRAGNRVLGRQLSGRSFGRIIAKASHDAEEILIGEIDLALIEDTRRNWPFLRDRRIDAYAPITQRFLDPANTPVAGAETQVEMPADRQNTARTGLPHARRVGAARGHMACLAAQPRRLAGEVSAHPLGLCGDRSPALGARARAHSR